MRWDVWLTTRAVKWMKQGFDLSTVLWMVLMSSFLGRFARVISSQGVRTSAAVEGDVAGAGTCRAGDRGSLVDELVELPAYELCELRGVDRVRAAFEELSEDRDDRVPLSG